MSEKNRNITIQDPTDIQETYSPPGGQRGRKRVAGGGGRRRGGVGASPGRYLPPFDQYDDSDDDLSGYSNEDLGTYSG